MVGEEEEGIFGLDETTVSLICGLSVLSVVLVIVTLGIIGFFIKVRFRNSVNISKLMVYFAPELYLKIMSDV